MSLSVSVNCLQGMLDVLHQQKAKAGLRGLDVIVVAVHVEVVTSIYPSSSRLTLPLLLAEAGKEKVERRLWVYGSVSSAPGTAAFFRTAKTEPLGDRVRLIFKADPVIGPAAGLPETPQGKPGKRCG